MDWGNFELLFLLSALMLLGFVISLLISQGIKLPKWLE